MKKHFFQKLSQNQIGATAIEYGLIAAVIVVASLGALTTMSSTFILSLNDTSSKVTQAMD